jgi:hypothetical protein
LIKPAFQRSWNIGYKSPGAVTLSVILSKFEKPNGANVPAMFPRNVVSTSPIKLIRATVACPPARWSSERTTLLLTLMQRANGS